MSSGLSDHAVAVQEPVAEGVLVAAPVAANWTATMKCITFRRWYPGTARDVLSLTYPIETDAHKISLADLITRDKTFNEFVDDRLDTTYMSVILDNAEGYALKECLQLFKDDYTDYEGDGQSVTFPIGTDTDKIVFANWVIEQKLGDFCNGNTHVFISDLYVPVVGRAVMVLVAEPVSTQVEAIEE